MTQPRWQLTGTARERGAHVLRCSPEDAAARLYERMDRATYRETDQQGRELWRSPQRDGGMRWIVEVPAGAWSPLLRRADPVLPRVLWVGQGAPDGAYWDPAPGGGERGEERIDVTLDASALRILRELATGTTQPGHVIGRALRELWERERGRR